MDQSSIARTNTNTKLVASPVDNILRYAAGQAHLFAAMSKRQCELNNEKAELEKMRYARKQQEKKLNRILLKCNMEVQARFMRLLTVKPLDSNKQLMTEFIKIIDGVNAEFQAESDLLVEYNQFTNDARASREKCDLACVTAQAQEKNLDIEIFKHCYEHQEKELRNFVEQFHLVENHSEIDRCADETVKLIEERKIMLTNARRQREFTERTYRI